MITSRPLGYQSARVERANIVQACGFTARQVELFVRSWYHEVEMHSISGAAKVDSDEINDRESRAREQANDLSRTWRTPRPSTTWPSTRPPDDDR